MAVIKFLRRRPALSRTLSDDQLLQYFATEPEAAWDLFIERYADLVLATLHHLGFDHDESMDRFVYICEKLCEHDFQRLRSIRHTGDRGELVPWLRTVVKNLSVSWAWSVDGRRRLFKSIADLPARQRRVFELYFWRGLTASEIHQQLRAETSQQLHLLDVLDALEDVFSHLNANQRWRLMSQLLRHRETLPIGPRDAEDGLAVDPPSPEADPETALLRQERQGAVDSALADLAARDRLILHLRYDEALTLAEVAQIMSLSLSTVKTSIRRSLSRLRQRVDPGASEGDQPCPA